MDELRHHGILGQKWGVRRYQNSDGSLTPAGKKRYSKNPIKRAKDFVEAEKKLQKKRQAQYQAATSKKTLAKMSDDDLRKKIARMELEKKYKDLEYDTITEGNNYYTHLVKSGVAGLASTAAVVGTVRKLKGSKKKN